MSLIIGEGVGKSYGAEPVLKNLSLRIGPQDRIGLVGPNGEGKTTLLRMLIGQEEPTTGTLRRKTGLTVGYLPQDPPAPRDTTLWQAMLDELSDLVAMEAEVTALAEDLSHSDGDPRVLKRYGALQARFEHAGGYSYPVRIETVLTGLGFARGEYRQPLAELSGGQRTRAYLAGLLLREVDVLCLDEPTNHLDLEATVWLERFLQDFRKGLVVVSHDRYFLDRLTETTWEVAGKTVAFYRGGYTAYVHQRAERFKERVRTWQAQQEHIARTEDFIRRNLSGQRSREARGRRTRLERFRRTEAIERPQDPRHIHIRIPQVRRSGDLVLRATDLACGYDPAAPLLGAEALEIRRTQRVAVIGANGAGKTTLLRTLLGQLAALSGKVERGAGVMPGYLSQTHEDLPPDSTALEAVLAAGDDVKPERARTLLGGFLLGGQEAFKKVSQLSGGQRSRVVLARLVVQSPNLLVLDEPTNHLDLPSREILQDVLADFEGTVVFVSHDRYLVQALATHIWALDGGEVHCLKGDWEAYAQWRSARRGGTAGLSSRVDAAALGRTRLGKQAVPPAVPGRPAPPRRRPAISKAERLERRRRKRERQRLERRHDRLEEQIHELEARLKELSDSITTAGEAGDVEEVAALGEEYELENARLRELWDEWVRIGEAMEG